MAKKKIAKKKSSIKKPAKKSAKKTVKITAKKAAAKKITIAAVKQSTLVGKKAPTFSVANSKGESVQFSNFAGKTVVLYFYPKDDTPGCTIEGHEFTALVPAFEAKNAIVLGVSKDSIESHNKFICKYDYKVELLSDVNGKLCDYFDVIKEKNMYGKKYMGIERSTFIIDSTGKIVKEFRKVKAEGHAQEILSQI